FNYDLFKNFVQFEMGLTPKTFIEEQRRELLASRVRDLLRASVTVSMNEVKADFERKGNQVNLEYVRFTPRRNAAEVVLTDADIDAYAKANDAKLRQIYDGKKFLYEKTPKELRLRQILVRGGSPDADKAAQKKIEAIAARIKKGDSFASVAKEATEDASSKGRGGEIGWRRQGTTNLPAESEQKLFAAKTGEVVGPLKSNEGWVLLIPESSREGDLSFDQVKLELAQEKLREERGGAQAKADALAALAKAKAAPAKTLKEIFPKGDDKDEKAAKPGAEDVPRAEETGLISARGGREGAIVEGVGVSNELSRAAFSGKPEELAGPFEVSGSYVIVRLKERKQADLAEFEKKKLELLRDAELTKWMDVLTDWTQRRCVEAKEAKHIKVSREILRYEDSAEPPAYEPCTVRRQLGG
ncbi:MAG TPA: peptidylprolyl isomerase, partial [Polyangia bacterium]|nr:peptidylprolyl isomerase [Polyangia bacterium]